MKLNECHDRRFQIMTGNYVWKSVQIFSQALMTWEKVGKRYFIGDDWPVF